VVVYEDKERRSHGDGDDDVRREGAGHSSMPRHDASGDDVVRNRTLHLAWRYTVGLGLQRGNNGKGRRGASQKVCAFGAMDAARPTASGYYHLGCLSTSGLYSNLQWSELPRVHTPLFRREWLMHGESEVSSRG
jgi:hypothetical protein